MSGWKKMFKLHQLQNINLSMELYLKNYIGTTFFYTQEKRLKKSHIFVRVSTLITHFLIFHIYPANKIKHANRTSGNKIDIKALML